MGRGLRRGRVSSGLDGFNEAAGALAGIDSAVIGASVVVLDFNQGDDVRRFEVLYKGGGDAFNLGIVGGVVVG